MTIDTSQAEMSQEDRLKAILYQFIQLYERWSEDRQVAAKRGEEASELVAEFTGQVQEFKQLEPQVRQKIVESISVALNSVIDNVTQKIENEAKNAVESSTHTLTNTVNQAENILSAYKTEVVRTQWKVILGATVTTIATCFLVFWFLMPNPVSPLTNEQIRLLTEGQVMDRVWPKLSKTEQQHWLELANQVMMRKK